LKKTANDKKKILLKLKQENELLKEKVSIQKDASTKLKESLASHRGGDDMSAKLKAAIQKDLEDTEAAIREEQAKKEALRAASSSKVNMSPALPTRSASSKPGSETTTPIGSPTVKGPIVNNASAFVPFDSTASSRTVTPTQSPAKISNNAFSDFEAFGSEKIDSNEFEAFGTETTADAFGGGFDAFPGSSPSKPDAAFGGFDAFTSTISPAKGGETSPFDAFGSSSTTTVTKNEGWDSFGSGGW
jgi:hypothetical protein